MYLNASMYSAIVAWILRKPHISLEDTFNNEQVKLYLPFTNCVLTGDYKHPSLGKKEIKYSGYQELLYLHPNNFNLDPSILDLLKVKEDEKYIILRFVSWNASHDIGHSGLSIEMKHKAVNELSKYVKVFITSEKELPDELKPYQIKILPERMHDALAFASLIYGESATMVSEGAVLGVPGIYLDNTGRLYTKEQEEKYGLVFNYTESLEDQEKSIQKSVELLATPGIKEEWQKRRERMLADKIDVTAFFVWFVENYPESVEVMKENPEYQLRFK
jgi:predicted glycosyltransferase